MEQATDRAETAAIFCFILSTGTRIRIDSVMCPRSSSRRHNTSASVTVTVLFLHCSITVKGSPSHIGTSPILVALSHTPVYMDMGI